MGRSPAAGPPPTNVNVNGLGGWLRRIFARRPDPLIAKLDKVIAVLRRHNEMLEAWALELRGPPRDRLPEFVRCQYCAAQLRGDTIHASYGPGRCTDSPLRGVDVRAEPPRRSTE